VGTVTPTGANSATYTAPTTTPTTNPVTIDAAAGTQSASATVTLASSAPIAVNVSPASATVAAGQTASFTATVTGTSNANVTWSVNGVTNGNSAFGEVCAVGSNPCATPSGSETTVEFLAPQALPQPDSVVLMATSEAEPTSTGSTQITILAAAPQPSVVIAPSYAFLDASQQFQSIASASGIANANVTWTISSAVPGQGCSGASCGSIDSDGNYTAPAVAPSPNAISIAATSVANPSLSATATVAVTSGPAIETVLPSSVIAGAQQSFELALQGLNFVATTGSGTSQILVNNSPRTTNCPTVDLCTITLQPGDVATAGALSIELQNPGTPPVMIKTACIVVFPFICFTAFGLLLPAVARSTTLAQLVNAATVVVHAKAVANQRLWHDGEIWTVTSFRVIETWKGSAPPEIDVWMIGGHVGRIISYVPGAPRFRPGEEAVLFLEPTRTGEMSITAWGEGTFRVRVDAHTGEARVTQDMAIPPEYDAAMHTFRGEGIRDWPLTVLKMRVFELEAANGSAK
jgi:hypothetical protein